MLRIPGGAAAPFEARLGPSGTVSLDADPALGAAAEATARRLLDLDADSGRIDAWLARDDALAPLIAARPGIRLPGSVDPHEDLFRTLVGQQVSVAAARTVLGRLVRDLGGDAGLFPTDVLLATDLVVLQGAKRVGLPSRPRELTAYGERWAPWRSYAVLRLWQAGRMPV